MKKHFSILPATAIAYSLVQQITLIKGTKQVHILYRPVVAEHIY